MAVTEFSVLQVGSRVRVRRGAFPGDPSLMGRLGTVVESSQYYPQRVGVSLDGEPEIRAFSPSELEIVKGPEALPPDVQAARKRLVRP